LSTASRKKTPSPPPVPASRRGAELYKVRDKAQSGVDELGLRERHKFDKLERISNAAHRLFSRDGYEGTTLREIAKEAGVALGTLGLYAHDKRDLILMLFNKVIPPLLEQGRKNAKMSGSLADSMIAFFEPFYVAYANSPTLYRIVLAQIYSGASSVHGNENNFIRKGLIDDLADLIRRAVTGGECSATTDLKLQAKSFYFLYFAAVRAWLADEAPTVKSGITELRALFEQHIAGLAQPRKTVGKTSR
jgi:AcrR family transcriptional regulator